MRDQIAPLHDSTATLLLFDVDGTLLRGAAGGHREALLRAVREVLGVEPPDLRDGDTAGRTDGEIMRNAALARGVSERTIDELAGDLRSVACDAYAELCPQDLTDTVLPGVRELLRGLAARDGAVLSLLTGNLEPIGRRKLAAAGIGSFFAPGQGAFGSDSERRDDLPEIARDRAAAGGLPHPRERTVVIGDTPRDIACARADGVRCIGVATGPHGSGELAAADAVAADATALAPLIEHELARGA